jgi:hypothetical protein
VPASRENDGALLGAESDPDAEPSESTVGNESGNTERSVATIEATAASNLGRPSIMQVAYTGEFSDEGFGTPFARKDLKGSALSADPTNKRIRNHQQIILPKPLI